jgi:hypothetical protein
VGVKKCDTGLRALGSLQPAPPCKLDQCKGVRRGGRATWTDRGRAGRRPRGACQPPLLSSPLSRAGEPCRALLEAVAASICNSASCADSRLSFCPPPSNCSLSPPSHRLFRCAGLGRCSGCIQTCPGPSSHLCKSPHGSLVCLA